MGRRQDRVHRFIARVDSHLPTLADDGARRAFLDRQLEGWERRYARFIATEGQSEPVAAPAIRRWQPIFCSPLPASQRGAWRWTNMRETCLTPTTKKSFGRTVLSLLVAADQCCPAIIGQAHLLYHSGSTTREEPKDIRNIETRGGWVVAALGGSKPRLKRQARSPLIFCSPQQQRRPRPAGGTGLPRASNPCSRGRT